MAAHCPIQDELNAENQLQKKKRVSVDFSVQTMFKSTTAKLFSSY